MLKKNFFVMDIETFEESGKVIPFLMTLKTNFKIFNFYLENNEDIISLFLNQVDLEKEYDDKIQIFTHNINFDGYILIEYFLNNNIPYKWFIRGLNLYYFDFTYKGSEIRVRCSYKLLGCSVKFLGSILEDYKKPFPYKFVSRKTLNYFGKIPNASYFENNEDYLIFCEKWGENFNLKNVTEDYASSDVNIVYKSLLEILKISNKSIFLNSFSFSSYSYKVFCKKYDILKISKIFLNLYQKNYIESAYFGGRTEIFGNVKKDFIHRFDFPGMYGSCMKEKFPTGIPFFSKPEDFEKPGFYTVTIKSELDIPILPIRSKNGTVLYPNGRFTTCLNRDEILLFIEKGGSIEKIHSALLYPNEEYIFEKFVEDFEKIKEKGGFYKLYGKQVINSLYGSFALNKDKVKYIVLYDVKELDFLKKDSKIKEFFVFNKMIIASIEVEESLNIRESRNVAYAAFISSKARIKLHRNVYEVDKYYKKMFKDSYKLLYLETDSIDISLPENRLGEKVMDVVWQKIYEKGVFISPKFYFLEGEKKAKIKGIRESKYTYEEISDFFYSNQEILTFKNQLQFDKKNFNLIQKYLDKNLKMNFYNKRKFSEDKLNTTALEIWE